MDCPILEVVKNHTTEEFFCLLQKYGKCTDFLEENAQKCVKKDAIFVGSVYAAHKPKFNKREDRTQCIIVLKLLNLIKGPHEHTLFRVVFIGRVVKDIVHLQKGDLIGILNPKLFFVMSSNKKIPSLAIGPRNVVLWVCRNEKEKGTKAADTEIRILSNSSDENASCLSLSASKDNRIYRNTQVNCKKINKPKLQASVTLSQSSNQSRSSTHDLKSFSKNERRDNMFKNDFPSENTPQDGSFINSNSCINSVNTCNEVNQINSNMPSSTRNDLSSRLSPRSNNHIELSQSYSSRQNLKSFSKNLRVDNELNNKFPPKSTVLGGTIINYTSCIDPVNTCHEVNQINSSMPRRNDCSNPFSSRCNNHRINKSCSHDNVCNYCFNRLSNCELNAGCCPQTRSHCRKISPCCAKPLCCPQLLHYSHARCKQISCNCKHSDCEGTKKNYCSRDESNGGSKTYFSQGNKERPSSSITNEPSKTCPPYISCCRPAICSHIMTHCCCSRFSHVHSPHKSPCNWKESFCLPENSCHAVSSNCCCNCSWNNHNHYSRNCSFGVQSPNNRGTQDQDEQDISRSSLYKESIIRTQDWVRLWQPADIPENCEPTCIESSSSSTASSHSMLAQNIIKPALNLTCLNNKCLGDSSLNTDTETSNVKKKRKLFNPANNSIVVEQKSPETVIEESTPFDSEQSVQNPLCLSKPSCKTVPSENQISSTECNQSNDKILVKLDENSKGPNVDEYNSGNCESLANKQNDYGKTKSFPDKEKNACENQESSVCSITEIDTVMNEAVNSYPDLNLKLTQVKSNLVSSALTSSNNTNLNEKYESNGSFSIEAPQKDLNDDQIVAECSALRPVDTSKKRKDVASISEKSSDEIELFSEKPLNKSKRLKSVDSSILRSESPKSDKSNETIDLGNETTKLFSPSKNPEKQPTKAHETSKFKESLTDFSSTSCGQSFYDALSSQNSVPESQGQWIIKPITEATDYISTAEKLYEIKATPRRNVKPISLKLYETFPVKGVIINIIPDLGDRFSIIQGFCHSKCKQSFKYEEFSFLGEVRQFNCTACRYHVHFECPGCREAGILQPLCLFYSFEIHLLVGDCVLRIEIDHQDAVDFLGCTPATYLRCSDKISQKLKKIITVTPPKSKDSVVILSATVRPKSKKGLTVLGIHKTFLSKHLTINGAFYKYSLSK